MARKKKQRGPGGGRAILLAVLLIAVAGGAFYLLTRLGGPAGRPGRGAGGADTSGTPGGDRALPASRSAVFFFGDPDAEGLRRELREVPAGTTVEEDARILVGELLRGPGGGDALPSLPEGTRLLRSFYDERAGILYLDFSAELRTHHWGGSAGELLTVRSLVATVAANLATVRAVQLLVDGQEVETLAGHVELSEPFDVGQWGKANGGPLEGGGAEGDEPGA